ncbi:hypothetical protein [Facklamia miroungae]|uniref:Uncharacterized protein n=1 Tax=Facklamia miroungae TaxID=120956 RepID=A0A1G7RXK5_9LACT|nr:hypothetical protein [Facklamia miroungae]NKZ29238.1 hypothetical protein [Facklamia miroungae]SDG15498.1 hypothetical protein SAMN05421791_103217 [Facklamia miroungae]
MIKALMVDLKLFRDRFKIYGFFNVFSLILILLLIVVGGKWILFTKANYLSLAMFFSLFLMMTGLTNINPNKNSSSKISMSCFFPKLGLDNINNYYKFRKFIFAYVTIIYLLFPFSTTIFDLKTFIFLLILLSVFILVSIVSSIYLSERLINNINLIIQLAMALYIALRSRGMAPFEIENVILRSDFNFLIILYFLIFILNIYLLSKKARKIKVYTSVLGIRNIYNPLFLFVLRTKIKFDIIIMIFFSIVSGFADNNYDEPIVFIVTFLGALYMIYYAYLYANAKRITLFYNASNLKQLRIDTISHLAKFSTIFCIIAATLGLLSDSLLNYIFYYLVTIISFIISNNIVRINIEKKINKKVILFTDLIKSIFLTIVFILFFLYVKSVFSTFK